jgi:hypothetical protein
MAGLAFDGVGFRVGDLPGKRIVLQAVSYIKLSITGQPEHT